MRLPFNGNYILTQGFGGNKESYIQFGLLGHNGLDYGLPSNTQIVAPHSGKVLEVGDEGTKGYGKYIKIESDIEGSVLAHLGSFQVKVGDVVSEGQPIALSDNTGNSTGPHLHWGYYKIPRNRQNGYSGMINQLPLIAFTSPPVSVPLAIPNPGYAPTFEGQTVEKDGIKYKSYKDASSNLLWKIEPQDDWKKKYEEEVIAHTKTKGSLDKSFNELVVLQDKIVKAKIALS